MKFNVSGAFWDAMFRMLSVVLVPMTVAGMGWYWTRWQQNVNDLKSMIDLVTDQSSEKQKYGIAMFEYLAKNGKVPVEFLAASMSLDIAERQAYVRLLVEQIERENARLDETGR